MKLFQLFIYGLISFSLHAQELMNRDSLLRILPNTPEDSSRVLLLVNLGQQYEGTAPETSKFYYRQARDLSKKIGYRLGEIKFATNYTYVLNMQGYYDSSLAINQESVKLARALHHQEYIAKCLFNTGTSYRLLEDYESALQQYLEALPILESLNDLARSGMAYDIIQGLYTQLKQYRKSINYGVQAVALLRKESNPNSLAIALSNLGMNYNYLRLYDSALLFYNEALRLSKQTGDQYIESATYLNIGDTYMQKLDYGQIEPYMSQALVLSKELGSFSSAVIAYRGLSYYYFFRKDYSRAMRYADSSLALSKQYALKAEIPKCYAQIANLSFAMQKFNDGQLYSQLSTQASDSLLNESIQKRVIEMDKKYQTAIKDEQIKVQEASIQSKTTWNYVLIGSAAAILLLSLLSYRNYRHRQRLQMQRITELETEKQLAATEAVLKGEEQERTRLAKDLHDGLGGMLSGIKYSLDTMKGNMIMTPENALAFEKSMDMLDSSIQEMRRVAHNMMPEALVKFGLDTALRDFCNDVNQSGALKVHYQSLGLQGAEPEQTKAITIYRIVQELLNNTMKHAVAGSALVQVTQNNGQLSITVEDDGKGFDASILEKSRGMGWSNIQNRVEFLKGNWDVDTAPGRGTSVHIEMDV